MHRIGVQRPDDAVRLAAQIADLEGVRYSGLLYYPGHIREPVEQQGAALATLQADLTRVLDALRAAGVEPSVVSGGSTPMAWRAHEIEGVTEVRPGTYVYNDRTTEAIGACAWDDCALTVLATVIAHRAGPRRPSSTRARRRSAASTLRAPDGDDDGWGRAARPHEVRVVRMSESTASRPLAHELGAAVGEQVRVVPNHGGIVVH